MWLRKVLCAAAMFLPLVLGPVAASAQGRGLERASEASAKAAAGANGKTITELPSGIAKVFSNLPLPPGLARRFTPPPPPSPPAPPPLPPPPPEPEPEPQPEPEPPVCDTQIVYIGGIPYMRDCNGNLTPLFGG
jgi:outer membrane biosynthesis protein TonB